MFFPINLLHFSLYLNSQHTLADQDGYILTIKTDSREPVGFKSFIQKGTKDSWVNRTREICAGDTFLNIN